MQPRPAAVQSRFHMTGLSLCQLFPFSKTYSRRRLYTRTTRTAPVLISLAKVLCKSFLFLSNSPDGSNTFRYVHKRERERECSVVLIRHFFFFSQNLFFFFTLWLVSSFLFHQSTYVCPAFVRLDLLFGFGHHQIQIPVKHVCLVILTYSMYDENFKGKFSFDADPVECFQFFKEILHALCCLTNPYLGLFI